MYYIHQLSPFYDLNYVRTIVETCHAEDRPRGDSLLTEPGWL